MVMYGISTERCSGNWNLLTTSTLPYIARLLAVKADNNAQPCSNIHTHTHTHTYVCVCVCVRASS
jgi:hypothetical protein